MFEAQVLVSKSGGQVVLSPWFPRQRDNAIFVVDVPAVHNVDFTIDVQHKKSDDQSSVTVAGTFSVISATGRQTKEILGLKELVRYKFTADLESEGDSWVVFRELPASVQILNARSPIQVA